jgi:PleD family two-component response regulator
MSSPPDFSESSVRPPIVVIGVEQEWAARSLETVLGPRGFAVVRAYSGRQTVDLAEVASADVVLIDSRLPDMDGIDVCRMLRADQRVGRQVPIVIMTSGPAPREFLRRAYVAGAWSVWEQPIDAELLLLRLQTWVDAKRVVDEAERLSFVDVESGLYTYRGLSRRVRELMSEAMRRRTPVSCIAIAPSAAGRGSVPGDDLPVPARVAAQIGQLLGDAVRGSDVVGHLGGSEFAILAPMTERSGAVELVERLRDRVAALPPLVTDGRSSRIALRAGLATVDESGLALGDGSDLLVRASTALRYAQSSRALDIRRFEEVPATFV